MKLPSYPLLHSFPGHISRAESQQVTGQRGALRRERGCPDFEESWNGPGPAAERPQRKELTTGFGKPGDHLGEGHAAWRGLDCVVPGARLELARVSPYAPQTYVSTNSTTRAREADFAVRRLRSAGSLWRSLIHTAARRRRRILLRSLLRRLRRRALRRLALSRLSRGRRALRRGLSRRRRGRVRRRARRRLALSRLSRGRRALRRGLSRRLLRRAREAALGLLLEQAARRRPATRREHGQRDRGKEEAARQHHGGARQEVGGATATEDGLRGAAEGATGETTALAGLQQDHQHQCEANENVKCQEQSVHETSIRRSIPRGCRQGGGAAENRSSEARRRQRAGEGASRRTCYPPAASAMPKKLLTSSEAPPTSAPSSCSSAKSMAAFFGLTLPP